MQTYLLKLLATCKNGIILIFSILASFIAPIQGLIFLSFVLCAMDFLVKLYVIQRVEGFKAIKSKKIGDTLFKALFYCTTLIVLQLTQVLFFVDFGEHILNMMFQSTTVEGLMKINLASFGAFLIIIREIKSIDENWESFSGWSFIESVTNKFSWVFKLKNGITTKEDDTKG